MATIKSWDTTDQLHVDSHHSAQVTILDALGNPIDAAHPLAVVLQGNGTVTVSDGGGSLTVDGAVSISNFPASQPVTGPLTDTQLRATAVPTAEARLPAALDADGGVKTHVQNFPATQPVTGPLTDAQLRASSVPVSGPLTDAQLRASALPTADSRLPAALDADGGVKVHVQNQPGAQPVTDNGGSLTVDGAVSITNLPATQPVSGTVTVSNPTANPETGLAKDATLTTRLPAALDADGGVKTHVNNFPASQAVTGPLTDTQLRAAAVPVSGPLTDIQLRASAVPVTGPLTDTQLRASAVPVAGPATDAQMRATPLAVSGPLTDAQMRATPIKETPTSPGGLSATVTAYGNLRITAESHAIFADPFDGAGIDTANRWNYTNNGQTFGLTGGVLALGGNTTASNWAALASQPSIAFPGVNYLAFGALVKFESVLVTGAHRFAGMGTPGGAFSAATPLTDAIGFEVGTDGRFYAVIYKSGVRTFAQDITASLNAGAYNRLGIAFRTDAAIFYINSLDVPVASFAYTNAGFAPPDNLSLPVRFHNINGTGAVSAAPTMQMTAIGVGDTGANHSQIADGTYPWRKVTVNSLGQLATARYPNLRTAFSATAQAVAAGATANVETLVSLTPTRAFVAGAAATSMAPTAGKTLRITDVAVIVRATSAAIIPITCRLRVNPAGAAAITSPIAAEWAAVTPTATIGSLAFSSWNWDDSIDLTGAMQFGVTIAAPTASIGAADIVVSGYEF